MELECTEWGCKQAVSLFFVSLEQYYLPYVIFTSLSLSPSVYYTALFSHALRGPLTALHTHVSLHSRVHLQYYA